MTLAAASMKMLVGPILATYRSMTLSLAFHCCWHVFDTRRNARISNVPRERV
jgi:hypothetical protein